MTDESLPGARVRILVVEDSAVARELLVGLFESVPDFVVAGTACNGEEAVVAAARLRPDVVTMDINMPGMNGFEATREIMQSHPVPIVIVSGSWNPLEVRTTFQAMQAGAVALVARPRGIEHPKHSAEVRELVRTVRSMAEVKVIRRRPRREAIGLAEAGPLPSLPDRDQRRIEIVALGASTGGPMALQSILAGLPAGLPFPIAIVQHISAGFSGGFVDWLAQSTGFPVKLAEHGDIMLPGRAYMAPDDRHMTVAAGKRIVLNTEPPDGGLRPSVAQLFRSVARTFAARSGAVLLTGMGADGARELKELRDLGALTVAQDAQSCVVNGMPGAAVKLDAAMMVLSPEGIAALIAGIGATESRRGPKACSGIADTSS